MVGLLDLLGHAVTVADLVAVLQCPLPHPLQLGGAGRRATAARPLTATHTTALVLVRTPPQPGGDLGAEVDLVGDTVQGELHGLAPFWISVPSKSSMSMVLTRCATVAAPNGGVQGGSRLASGARPDPHGEDPALAWRGSGAVALQFVERSIEQDGAEGHDDSYVGSDRGGG